MKINLLYLSPLAFVLISTSAISLSRESRNNISIQKTAKVFNSRIFNRNYSDLPILKNETTYPILSAQSVMVIDMVSGVTLFEKDPDRKMLPASTTKIMTALVALDTYELDQVLKVNLPKLVDGQKMGLVRGEEIKFIDLLKGLLIYSANDAAEVMANNHPGGRQLFIGLMNKKAKDLGLKDTHFENPTGFDGLGQYSTTKDLVILSKHAMKNPLFAELVSIKTEIVKSIDGKLTHRLTNINKLLGEVPGVLGVKTGWTENARENLVTYVERDGRKIMIAVLGSSDRFGETKELIDWIFENYTWEKVKPF